MNKKILRMINNRKLPMFLIDDRNNLKLIKEYYINNTVYWIGIYKSNNNKSERFLVSRIATKEEEKYIEDICGLDCPLIDLTICDTLRQAIDTVKKDAANKVLVQSFFDIKEFSNLYKDMKEYLEAQEG